MARPQNDAAAATVIEDADSPPWSPGTDVTIRLIRALVAGCRAEPGLNGWFDGNAGRRHVMAKIDVGIAVDLPDGLFVPVLRDVAHRDAPDGVVVLFVHFLTASSGILFLFSGLRI